ncbi:MAG TPA: sulfite oxidase-like oxidoreductase [Acidimicrobiia bacterium]|nr:sulfite oxidase-like oxidoreductase [Acidimicrobiia bacterium]
MSFISRGFRGRRQEEASSDRVPPGQYLTDTFPVLSAGPTPRISLEEWKLRVTSDEGEEVTWNWDEFTSLPQEEVKVDIHCVTKWSKLDTGWEGVPVDVLLERVSSKATFVLAHSYGGYTTNLPREDVTGGKAWVVHRYEGQPLEPEHGGPARLLVPHLYFWKSAKWLHRLELRNVERPGFWEVLGYHIYGDPWKEQRYAGD